MGSGPDAGSGRSRRTYTKDRVVSKKPCDGAGGEVALELFRSDLAVERKSGKTDVVTRADREAEQAVLEAIRAEFPEDPVVASNGRRHDEVLAAARAVEDERDPPAGE